jgi:lipoprotein-releasing system permease protein
MRRFTVGGVFYSGMYEIDSGLALVHMADAARLMRTGAEVTGLRLAMRDPLRAPSVAREVAERLGGGLWVEDWTERHANFFRSIELTKRMMFFILLLVVAVAAFNIVSTLVMAVTDKRADIAILRTLGASPGGIMKIFIVQGALIGVIGTLIGVATGIPTAINVDVIVPFLERLLSVQFLSREVYYISELPSDLQRGDVIVVTLVSLALSLLATLYPSWRASKVNPAEALRYE